MDTFVGALSYLTVSTQSLRSELQKGNRTRMASEPHLKPSLSGCEANVLSPLCPTATPVAFLTPVPTATGLCTPRSGPSDSSPRHDALTAPNTFLWLPTPHSPSYATTSQKPFYPISWIKCELLLRSVSSLLLHWMNKPGDIKARYTCHRTFGTSTTVLLHDRYGLCSRPGKWHDTSFTVLY